MFGHRRHTSLHPGGRSTRLAILLGTLVLLPALFYAGYEISHYSQNEDFIREVYRRQLDAILYSVNQYAWDVTSNWANSISGILDRARSQQSREREPALIEYLQRSLGLKAIVLVDSSLSTTRVVSLPNDAAGTESQTTIGHAFHDNREQLVPLSSWQSRNYLKLVPLALDSVDAGKGLIVLAFAHVDQRGNPAYVGLLIDQEQFARAVIFPKLNDLAAEEFILATGIGSLSPPSFATGEIPPGRDLQAKPLWIFPSYLVGITLRGESLDDLVRARLENNLLYIGVFAILLVGVAWFGFRTIRAELELARARSRLVSNVSHELRTPLALIRMYAETLEMGRLSQDAKKQEYYQTILRESERLTHLVNNILDFSRMETGQKRYNFQPTDVNEVIEGVLHTYRARLLADGIDPGFDRAPSVPLVKGDRDAIAEAVINLVDNAAKYRGGDSFLRIRTGVRGDRVCVEVEDHGIGISPAHQKKIFDAFYRVEDPLVQSTKGSGIGLSLVKQIALAHEGDVELESTPGRGSTFRLVFRALASEKDGTTASMKING